MKLSKTARKVLTALVGSRSAFLRHDEYRPMGTTTWRDNRAVVHGVASGQFTCPLPVFRTIKAAGFLTMSAISEQPGAWGRATEYTISDAGRAALEQEKLT